MIGNGHVQFYSNREKSNLLPASNRVRLEGQRLQVPSYPNAASEASDILYP